MPDKNRARRYAIISGKGGVGKTVITANLAAALAAGGQRVLVVDADLGLANLDVILGENPVGTIQDVIAGDLTVEEAIVRTRSGFDLLPAGSGALEMLPPTGHLGVEVISFLERIEHRYDAILFDAGAGIGEVVLHFARLADEIVLVVTPEPTSVMDAYATIKVLALRYGFKDIRLIVNQADPATPGLSGMRVANHLQSVVTKFVSAECGSPVRLHFAGSFPSDPGVSRSIKQQRLLAEMDPANPVAALMPLVAESLQSAISQNIV
jgi:flagellar biosynthesis protein FlhG